MSDPKASERLLDVIRNEVRREIEREHHKETTTMSDTNELLERAAGAMAESDHIAQDGSDDYDVMAAAVLAVAEPAIRADERRKVIEELIVEAKSLREAAGRRHEERSDWMWRGVADWLRAQDDDPETRKIYIGFKQKDKEKGDK